MVPEGPVHASRPVFHHLRQAHRARRALEAFRRLSPPPPTRTRRRSTRRGHRAHQYEQPRTKRSTYQHISTVRRSSTSAVRGLLGASRGGRPRPPVAEILVIYDPDSRHAPEAKLLLGTSSCARAAWCAARLLPAGRRAANASRRPDPAVVPGLPAECAVAQPGEASPPPTSPSCLPLGQDRYGPVFSQIEVHVLPREAPHHFSDMVRGRRSGDGMNLLPPQALAPGTRRRASPACGACSTDNHHPPLHGRDRTTGRAAGRPRATA